MSRSHRHGRKRGRRAAPLSGARIPFARQIRFSGQGDFLIAATYVVVASLLGGGAASWGLAYIALVLTTIVMAGLFAWRDGLVSFTRLPLPAAIALPGIAIVPLLQLIPMPPALWQALPGQELRIGTLSLVGLQDTWQPLSLEPVATSLIALLAIGFVAFTGLLLRLNRAQFRRLLAVASIMVVIQIAIGLLQVVSSGQPQFYSLRQGATMLGLFANKNHLAIVIACSIAIVGFVVVRDYFNAISSGRNAIFRGRAAMATYLLIALTAIVTTNSRAGLILGVVAALPVLFNFSRGVALRWRLAIIVVLVFLAALIISTSAFETVSGRVAELDDDLRWNMLEWSKPLVESYWLAGSGLGSYTNLFAAHEQLAWVTPNYVNAVHNDYVQLVIEAGVPGIVVFALLAVALLRSASSLLPFASRSERWCEMAMGYTIVLLFALHSVVDYPLRRPAAWIFLAIGLAAIFGKRREERTAPQAETKVAA